MDLWDVVAIYERNKNESCLTTWQKKGGNYNKNMKYKMKIKQQPEVNRIRKDIIETFLKKGYTYHQIGLAFKVSRQRVKQIRNKPNIPPNK
jgi:Sigma-70, region 4.